MSPIATTIAVLMTDGSTPPPVLLLLQGAVETGPCFLVWRVSANPTAESWNRSLIGVDCCEHLALFDRAAPWLASVQKQSHVEVDSASIPLRDGDHTLYTICRPKTLVKSLSADLHRQRHLPSAETHQGLAVHAQASLHLVEVHPPPLELKRSFPQSPARFYLLGALIWLSRESSTMSIIVRPVRGSTVFRNTRNRVCAGNRISCSAETSRPVNEWGRPSLVLEPGVRV